MSVIADFLNAQYDRIEEAAQAATEGPWTAGAIADDIGAADVLSESGNVTSAREEPCCSVEDAVHIAIHDPAHVLADIESKRQILSLHRPESEGGPDPICNVCLYTPPCETVRALAAPFSGEPGYDAERWAV